MSGGWLVGAATAAVRRADVRSKCTKTVSDGCEASENPLQVVVLDN